MEKVVSFYDSDKSTTNYFLCELEEILQGEEEKFFNSKTKVVVWSYGWGDKGYHYIGHLTGKSKDPNGELWTFNIPGFDCGVIQSVFYDSKYPSTRNKLYKMVKKLK